jgi:cardiolipin synthase
MSEPLLTVANLLTVLRMGLTPFFVILVIQREYGWACATFLVAGATDLLDGLIARIGHQQTRLGATLDPIADKLLLMSSFVVLTWGHGLSVRVPQWLTVLTISRDVMIVISAGVITLTLGLRAFPPSWPGKLTTLAQIATAGAVILLNALGARFDGLPYLFQATAVLTVLSGLHYVYLAFHERPPAAGGDA